MNPSTIPTLPATSSRPNLIGTAPAYQYWTRRAMESAQAHVKNCASYETAVLVQFTTVESWHMNAIQAVQQEEELPFDGFMVDRVYQMVWATTAALATQAILAARK